MSCEQHSMAKRRNPENCHNSGTDLNGAEAQLQAVEQLVMYVAQRQDVSEPFYVFSGYGGE
jgi:hypothetical protein